MSYQTCYLRDPFSHDPRFPMIECAIHYKENDDITYRGAIIR